MYIVISDNNNNNCDYTTILFEQISVNRPNNKNNTDYNIHIINNDIM